MEDKIENIEEIFLKTYSLAWTYDFINVNFRKDRVDEYLKGFIEEDKKVDKMVFIRDGVKFSLTPLILELIVEKLERFKKNQKDDELIKIAGLILEFLKKGVAPWDIPFFSGIFVRQVFQHPLSMNQRIFELIYEFIPKKIVNPEDKKEEKKEEKSDIPKGYKKTDSGLIVPE